MTDQRAAELCNEFWKLLISRAERHGATPIKGKIWTCTAGRWVIKTNGHGEKKDGIPPYSCALEYNGFPAGIIDPYGGLVAAGSQANIETLVEAMRAANAEVIHAAE